MNDPKLGDIIRARKADLKEQLAQVDLKTDPGKWLALTGAVWNCDVLLGLEGGILHTAASGIGMSADIIAGALVSIGLLFRNIYHFEARDSQGNLKWIEEVPNLVTTEGLNDLLTKYLKGSSYTAAWYVGLVNNSAFSAFVAGDTAAQIGGSNGWAEATTYSESVRQTLTLGSAAAGSISNTASKAVFSINGTVTIHGGFVASVSTKSGTTGVLYGEAAFSADRSLVSGDTLTITVTLTAASA